VKAPSPVLVVDAAILVAAVRGRSSGAIREAARHSVLTTTNRVLVEARRRIELGMKRPELLPLLESLARELTVAVAANFEPVIGKAEAALQDAVVSRNGSTRDAHLLALAWSVDGDIWSGDRDFAGTGVASWTTPNLMRGYACERAQRENS